MDPSNADLRYPELRDEDWLRHQVVHRKLSLNKLSSIIGCTERILIWWLDSYGISISRDVEFPEIHDRTWLKTKYVNENHTANEIGELIGCSTSHVKSQLQSFNITKSGRLKSNFPQLLDKEWLYEKYIIEKLASDEISDIIGCSSSRVRDFLAEYGISKQKRHPKLRNEGWLRQKYVSEGLSDNDIALITGTTASQVGYARSKFGIRRDIKYPKLRDRDWLDKKYNQDLLSLNEIGKEAGGASSGTVREWLFKHNIL